MLKIYYGKAGTGKSAAVMNEICDAVKNAQGSRMLIVPEQYSHEAERELCQICGDSLSLYAEVFSFTGLARRFAAVYGGAAEAYLDKGGKMLCMALASDAVASRLKVYSGLRRRAEMQNVLLAAVDELKTACIDSEKLLAAAAECDGALADKLSDLALVQEAYDAAVAQGSADPSDRLNRLCEQLEESDLSEKFHIYLDGFTDFTAQEMRCIEAMISKNARVTVCLGCDDLKRGSETFELSRLTAKRLIAYAEEKSIPVETRRFTDTAGKNPALSFFADNMFSFSRAKFEGETAPVEIIAAPGISAECELAAAKAISLVRETGCRWHDIAIAVRGFEDYRQMLESVFHHYGVPLYTARKSDLLSKPLPALIAGAYEIMGSAWELDDIMFYLRTDLAGLDREDCDILENYAFMWQLRGLAWKQEKEIRLHPEGYGAEYTDETNDKLRYINALRRKAVRPLLNFEQKSEEAATARQQAQALADFLEELKLADRLEKKAEELRESGREAAAQEYQQLWDICVGALEQCVAVLGDTPADREYFGRLFTLMLSKYDVGTIPAALDRVLAGDFDRMRRRRIKHLIVLGASDSRIPQADAEGGVFSSDERKRLLEMDIDLGGAGDCELWREFSLIYNCLTLPSESLSFIYSGFSDKGEQQRPAFVVNRAKALFNLEIKNADMADAKMNSAAPALELAANAISGLGEAEAAAAEYFRDKTPQRLELLEAAAKMSRGSLSDEAVKALYGKKLRLSASRIDRFASCRFAYFMQYGLKAKTREPAGFAPPELGIFMHFVLEKVASEVMEKGGFKHVSDEELKKITDKYVAEYVHETLDDFREKTPRFEYLFRRLINDVRRVVADMAAELRVSDFEPLAFELDFGNREKIPPVELGEGEDSLTLTGIADRVDGWVHDGKLYLRVVDYKTGHKKFSLADVWNGMGLQMLLYLFTLGRHGDKIYGKEVVSAGVLYIPAKDVRVSASSDMSDDKIASERSSKLKRSGLILDDEAVINAMEHGDSPVYIPVKYNKSGKAAGDALASAERLGLLSKHIDETLREMATQLRRGSIIADPYYKSQQETACRNCDYFEACHFVNGENGESVRRIGSLSATKVWNMLEGGQENV